MLSLSLFKYMYISFSPSLIIYVSICVFLSEILNSIFLSLILFYFISQKVQFPLLQRNFDVIYIILQ